jgi:hypothetical protein
MKRITPLLLLLALASSAWSWWGVGHGILTQAAVQALPEDMPAFFQQGEETVANVVHDADLFKNRATPHLGNFEHSEHYFDTELLKGIKPPEMRYAFLDTCAALGLNPAKVGLLPYAVAEWTERLAMAFAEHRRWPDNLPIQYKCLVYAGMLSHYSEDLCQPLHVTIHFDGRKGADGTVMGKGIHEKVDGFVEKMELTSGDLAENQKISPFAELMPAIMAEVEESRALIDRVYELEAEMGNVKNPQVREFAEERMRATVQFTASLYLTAWEMSEKIKLPGWHKR